MTAPISEKPVVQTTSRLRTRPASPLVGRPGAIWALPGLLYFVLFAIGPMFIVLYLSFTTWGGLGSPQFVGLDNWTRLINDPGIAKAVGLSLVLTVGSLIIQAPLALLLGVYAAGPQRNRAVLSAIFFVPLLLSSAAIAIVWKNLLDPNFGIPGQLSEIFGGSGNFLGTSSGAMIAVILVASWQFIPFHTLIYQGAVRAISPTLYQAASIDGAGMFRQFWSITLPQLRNTMITSSILMVVGSLTFFETVLILTQGGPGSDTAILPYLMYQFAFKSYDMGYGSAIAVLLVVVATAVSLIMVKLSGFDKMHSTQEGV